MGVKRGKTLPDYPAVISKRVTCKDALEDLPDAEAFAELREGDAVVTSDFGEPSKYAAGLRGIGNDAWAFGHPRNWEPAELTSSARTEHTDISRRRFRETDQGQVGPISRLFKLPADGVSNTLRAGTDADRGAFTSPRPIHNAYARCITVREMARLHGFPDWFRFQATKWHGARQIGNSVPPPLAQAVAGQIVKALGVRRSRPTVANDLADTALLTMNSAQTSAHFGVENPIGRRDKKSGAKKRSQAEIEALDSLHLGAKLVDRVTGDSELV